MSDSISLINYNDHQRVQHKNTNEKAFKCFPYYFQVTEECMSVCVCVCCQIKTVSLSHSHAVLRCANFSVRWEVQQGFKEEEANELDF